MSDWYAAELDRCRGGIEHEARRLRSILKKAEAQYGKAALNMSTFKLANLALLGCEEALMAWEPVVTASKEDEGR